MLWFFLLTNNMTIVLDSIDLDEIKSELAIFISPARFDHSLEVAKTAIELAKRFDLNEKRAEIAGLLHDCAKYHLPHEYLQIARNNGIEPDSYQLKRPALLHADISAVYAKEKYNIDDDEILSSIKKHTLGDDQMGMLDKIIYLADYVEPTRNHHGHQVETIYKALDEGIEMACLMVLNYKREFVKYKKWVVHPRTDLFKAKLEANMLMRDI